MLTSVSDAISLITGAATNIDVHAAWLDFESATGVESVLPGRTNTLITTAATTTIVAAPGDATTYRNVKTITIRNRDAVALNQITVKLTDGSNNVELISVVLSPGSQLIYLDKKWSVISAHGAILVAPNAALAEAKIDFSASGDTTIIAAVATKIIKVFRMYVVVAAATNIIFKDGATALSGAVSFVQAGSSIAFTDEGVPHYVTAAGNAFVINSSNAVQVSGTVWYAQV